MLNKGRTWMSAMYVASGCGHLLFPLPAGAWVDAVHGGHVRRKEQQIGLWGSMSAWLPWA